jgi:hypothetical protein
VAHQGAQDRLRIREAAGLDQHVAQRSPADVAALAERTQCFDQIAAHGTAHASVGEQHRVLARLRDEVVVDADRAELVDDHRGTGKIRQAQQRVDQRRLAAAKEAGEHRHRHA